MTKVLHTKTLTHAGLWSAVISRGKTLRLTDLEGGANAGVLLYNADLTVERYNMPDTLKGQHIFHLRHPCCLHSDMGRLLASITADSVGWHDTVCGCSDAKLAAEKYGVKTGDTLEVASQHGKLQAPALITPAIAPDVIAMPIGQGHENFTRYATGRGANPISILAPMTVEGTSSLAWAATRVKISRVGEGKIVMFGASMEETPADTKHR